MSCAICKLTPGVYNALRVVSSSFFPSSPEQQPSFHSYQRTEMAAAALSRRGVAGVRSTKGLFFILTLLSLLCVANSLINKDQLEKLKEEFQTTQQKVDSLKAEYRSASEFMSEYMIIADPLMALLKKESSDFPPVAEFLKNIEDFVEKTKTFIDGNSDEFGDKIEETEEKLGKIKNMIKFLEEQQAEF